MSAAESEKLTKGYLRNMHLEFVRPVSVNNLAVCDALKERREILKAEYGHWKANKDGPIFKNSKRVAQWNDLTERI